MPKYRSQSLGIYAKPFIAGNPVRKVVTKRKKHVTGWFSSIKMNGYIPWESQIERDMYRLLEVDNNVKSYAAQPSVLVYPFKGHPRKYYPDAEVKYWSGETAIIEVKSQDDADDPENQEVFDVLKRIYAGKELDFRVVTDTEIRQAPLLANANTLLEFRDRKPSPKFAQRVSEVFNLNPPRTLGDLEATLGLDRCDRGLLFGMALRGHFSIAIDAIRLGSESPVFRCNPDAVRW